MRGNKRIYTKTEHPYCIESGKTQFAKKKQALSRANSEGVRKGAPLSVYKCPFCGDWHLTSK